MYSEDDINSAVSAGALSADAAASFRAHMTKVRDMPRGSEEEFRLINSFNDIFVAIGIVILLLAVGAIGQAIAGLAASDLDEAFESLFGGLLVAGTAWMLSEFFTRKRRMALPSILLLLAFVGGTFAAALGLGMAIVEFDDTAAALTIAVSALVATGAAYLHWHRFMVPITVAAGAAAVSAMVLSLILALIGSAGLDEQVVWALVFIVGLGVFAFAMRWDMSDRGRITRRSDVAFWLHLLAAPMIAHPVFAMLGVTEGDDIGVGGAIGVLAVYIGFGLVALAIDRRALLVSALAYALFALAFLFDQFGAVELTFALTALVIGSALLSLSAFWQPIRRGVVGALPEGLQDKLPATDDAALAPPAEAAQA